MEQFRLVRPEKQHEQQAMEYLEEFYAGGSETHGIGGLERFKTDYDGWLRHLDKIRHIEPGETFVPAETFFLMRTTLTPIDGRELVPDGGYAAAADYYQASDERIVGMINVRLGLNDNLWRYGGHIGYSIRPSERRKGYNKINLYLALEFCQLHGLEVVLLDCDKDNLGSSRTMRALGGRLIREHWYDVKGQNTLIQDYVIDVNAAIAAHSSEYFDLIREYPTKV